MTVADTTVQLLKNPSKDERVSAATMLGELEHGHDDAVPALQQALRDADRDVRLASLNSLMKIWRTLHAPSMLTFADEHEQDPGQLFESVIPELKKLLHDQDKHVRFQAADLLRNLYSANDDVLNVFIASARDHDEGLRRRAAFALWQGAADLELVLSSAAPFLGGDRAPLHEVASEQAIAVLIELLHDTSRDVREYTVNAIQSLGPQANAAASALLLTLEDHDEVVRFKAAGALSSVGGPVEAALPILIEALTDDDRLKRKAAAFSLRTLGPVAKPATPALIRALKDVETRVRARCAAALGNIGPEVGDDAIQALIALGSDRDQRVREAAAQALADIGKDVVAGAQKRAAGFKARDSFPLFGFKPEDVPGLIFMLRDPNADIRAYAATAIGLASGDAHKGIPDLIALLKDADADVRRRAAQTLKGIGDAAAPALREAAQSGDPLVSEAAQSLLAGPAR